MRKIIFIVLSLFMCFNFTACNSSANEPTNGSATQKEAAPALTTTAPIISKNDYIGKEGLLVYHDLKDKGYTVEANYTTELGEALAEANQKLIDTFDTLDPKSEEDRLSVDTYVVDDVIQNGDAIELIIK